LITSSESVAEHRSSRVRGLLASLAAVPALVVGAFVMSRSGVGYGLWLQNVVVGAILTVVCVASAAVPGYRARASSAVWTGAAIVALLVLAATLTQAGVDGVRRWLPIGPLRLHVASVALPVLVIAIARQVRSGAERNRSLLARIVTIATAATLLMQPDASQGSAFGLAVAVLLLWGRRPSSADWIVVMIVAVCAGATWFRSDPLAPVSYVEGVVGLAADIRLAWLVACLVALVLLPLPFLVTAVSPKGEGTAHLAIAMYLVAVCAAPFTGAYPVPMIGYGLSPILGYFVALAWSVRNQAAPSRSTAIDANASLGETA
jgi:cell division protein FtsW (lipid II flippase)